MIFYLIGVNYRKTDDETRDRICREAGGISDFWAYRASSHSAILKTCNRLEIYAWADSLGRYLRDIFSFSREFPYFLEKGYVKAGKKNVFFHSLRLAAGLDSQLKGELQIMEQIREWANRGAFSHVLADFWNDILELAADIREESGLDKREYNVASLVFDDLQQNMNKASRQRVAVIGTGKVARLFSEFKPSGVELYFAAHKNYQKAEYLAAQAGGKALRLKNINSILTDVDALVGATSSPHIILRKGDLIEPVSKRHSPLYVYDLAVPRDIEPEVGRLEGVILKDLNSSDSLFSRHSGKIRRNLEWAEYLVKKAAEKKEEEFNRYDIKDWNQAKQIGRQAS